MTGGLEMFVRSLLILLLALSASACGADPVVPPADPGRIEHVVLHTRHGAITIALYPDKAPQTVANFLTYVDEGFYTQTLFHRVIPKFMIQGGGFEPRMVQKPTFHNVANESHNGLPNRRGSVAMARLTDPDSASSQFFINLVDNHYLNGNSQKPGYTVFGWVVSGMEVADKIATEPTDFAGPYENVPVNDVVIEKIERVRL